VDRQSVVGQMVMQFPGIAPGLKGERQVTVTEALTTTHVGGARILTAPAMIMEAELVDVDDRRLLFRVEAYNARDKIGEGTLRRTIVRLGTLA
jgi:predicted thioesterase